MIELTVQQGSPEWLAARAKFFNASEAPAMMGVSPYKTRSALLHEKATGIGEEHDAGTLARFAAGHAAEAAARSLVEQNILGEELFPVVATDDDGRLLASSDGATMLYDTGFEHKLWNAEIVEMVRAGQVPDYHAWQLDQQIHIFGFERIIFVCSDGMPERFVWCEYRSSPERIARLLAGWDQFERDLAEFVPKPETVKPAGAAPEALPALRIEVTGMVTASNLAQFREHTLAVFGGIKTDLQTDQDFADAEKTVKWCKEVEDKMDAAKQHALSQTASIDELFRTIDAIKEEARQKRLTLDKLVKAEKENRKGEIVTAAMQALINHVVALNARIGGNYLPADNCAQFGEAIKGLKSLDSMRDKVATALANAKIEANALADRIDANRKTVEDMSLMPDFAQVCTKAPDDFAALLAMRVQQRKDAEDRRLAAERERIRAEEQAKAQREADAARRAADEQAARERAEADRIAREAREAEDRRIAAERAELARQQEAIDAERRRQQDAAQAELAAKQVRMLDDTKPVAAADPQPVADTSAKVTLGQINAQLAPIQLSTAALASLGIQPAGRERAAVLYLESDVPRICAVLIRHLVAVSSQMKQAA